MTEDRDTGRIVPDRWRRLPERPAPDELSTSQRADPARGTTDLVTELDQVTWIGG